MSSRVIAIDGPAGSGKSSTARAVAAALEMAHLDSGALYRAVTLAALDSGNPLDGQTVVASAESLPVRLTRVRDRFVPEVAGVDVSHAVRTSRVTSRVSSVAAIPVVREWVTRRLRDAPKLHPRGVVVDGRDIGTVVFPDAPLKVFLTASVEERARRRSRDHGLDPDSEAGRRLISELSERDRSDSERAVAPLRPAAGARVLDTTGMSFQEQVDVIVEMARKLFK